MFIIFDLDGTLRDISHRTPLVRGGRSQWKEFFEATKYDSPNWDVLNVFVEHVNSGNRVEIWSGACESTFEDSRDCLNKWVKDKIEWDILPYEDRCVGQFIAHMRPKGNYEKDYLLKEKWLLQGDRPDIVYDDRYSVIKNCWRKNGVTCAQVAPYFDIPVQQSTGGMTPPRKPTLYVMIGPSGGGKPTYIQDSFNHEVLVGGKDTSFAMVVSSDEIRRLQFPSKEGSGLWCDPLAYDFEKGNMQKTHKACFNIMKSYLEAGVDVISDATNLRAKHRKDLLKFLDPNEGENFNVVYVIVDRPLKDKLETADYSFKRTSEEIIKKHHGTFQSSKSHAMKGDDFKWVKVEVVE